MRAELQVEVEKLAFHELKYRLHLEEEKHRYSARGEGGTDGEGEVGRNCSEGGADFTEADSLEGPIVSTF